ncbi:MAG: hypothetical protein GY792_21545 [Gammaproteobacteria bacterium]|nr:hypothetical protein [Gammaproteobacteria bacterium]
MHQETAEKLSGFCTALFGLATCVVPASGYLPHLTPASKAAHLPKAVGGCKRAFFHPQFDRLRRDGIR